MSLDAGLCTAAKCQGEISKKRNEIDFECPDNGSGQKAVQKKQYKYVNVVSYLQVLV